MRAARGASLPSSSTNDDVFTEPELDQEEREQEHRRTDRDDYRGVQGDEQLAATEELLGIRGDGQVR